MTALCAATNASPEVTAFIGNVVGAEAVTILGNQRSIERTPAFRHVECLLKMHRQTTEIAQQPRKRKRKTPVAAANDTRVPPKG